MWACVEETHTQKRECWGDCISLQSLSFPNRSRAAQKSLQDLPQDTCYPKYSWGKSYSVSRVIWILMTCFLIHKHGIPLVQHLLESFRMLSPRYVSSKCYKIPHIFFSFQTFLFPSPQTLQFLWPTLPSPSYRSHVHHQNLSCWISQKRRGTSWLRAPGTIALRSPGFRFAHKKTAGS